MTIELHLIFNIKIRRCSSSINQTFVEKNYFWAFVGALNKWPIERRCQPESRHNLFGWWIDRSACSWEGCDGQRRACGRGGGGCGWGPGGGRGGGRGERARGRAGWRGGRRGSARRCA